jgi:serine protease Do/serine protease DegQ
VRADGLTELPFGNSDRLEVRDFVFAIGNPQKIGQTVTAGIVSGLHLAHIGLGLYEDFIQTDAAIYPGNSGGALVDLRGDFVGINTAFNAVGKDNPGMGFAIPINMARSLDDQMLEFGDIRRGALGFTYDDFASALPRGAVVCAVAPRSAAERAGLKPGDLVTELGGTPLRNAADLHVRLALLRIGEVAAHSLGPRCTGNICRTISRVARFVHLVCPVAHDRDSAHPLRHPWRHMVTSPLNQAP